MHILKNKKSLKIDWRIDNRINSLLSVIYFNNIAYGGGGGGGKHNNNSKEGNELKGQISEAIVTEKPNVKW